MIFVSFIAGVLATVLVEFIVVFVMAIKKINRG